MRKWYIQKTSWCGTAFAIIVGSRIGKIWDWDLLCKFVLVGKQLLICWKICLLQLQLKFTQVCYRALDNESLNYFANFWVIHFAKFRFCYLDKLSELMINSFCLFHSVNNWFLFDKCFYWKVIWTEFHFYSAWNHQEFKSEK